MKKYLIYLIVIVFLISCGAYTTEKLANSMKDMRALGEAIEIYHIDLDDYPDTIDKLHPEYMRDPPKFDAWRNEFVYNVSSDKQNYELISKGPDGKLNTEDDIVLSKGLFTKSP